MNKAPTPEMDGQFIAYCWTCAVTEYLRSIGIDAPVIERETHVVVDNKT